MKISRFLAAATGAAVLFGVAGAPFAQAEGDSTFVTFTVTGGALAISAPAGTTEAPLALTQSASNTLTGGLQITASLGNTTVDDTRNALTGWTAYANATTFTQTHDDQGDPVVEGADTVPASAVNIKVRATDVVTQTLGTTSIDQGVGTQLFVPTAGTDGTGSGDGGAIGTTTANLVTLLGVGLNSNNQVVYNPFLTITVPPDTANGTYKGEITQTVL